MTPEQINKRFAERAGIKPKKFYYYPDAPGTEYYPDFCADPRLVLEVMKKREDWIEFADRSMVIATIDPFTDACTYAIPIYKIQDKTGLFAREAISFMEEKK